MKKLFVVLMVFVICLGLGACGGDNSTGDTPSGTSAVETSNNPATSVQRPEADEPEEGVEDNASEETATGTTFDSEAVISQIEVRDYTYTDSIGTSWTILVLKNNSKFDLDLNINVTFKDEGGNIIGAQSSSESAFEKGCEIATAFMNDIEPSSIKHTITAKKESYYGSVLSDLSSEAVISGSKVIITVTNNGEAPAEFVEGTALFFNGETLVYHGTTYFTDNDYEIKPGATINEEISAFQDFDSVQVYFTGRR